MDAFQRLVTSIAMLTISAIAIAVDWLLGIDIPVWAWMSWVAVTVAWCIWSVRIDKRETRRIKDQVDSYLKSITDLSDSVIIGGVALRTHSADQCAGEVCCIHNPSDHKMSKWSQMWREDIRIMERICPHGVGHPDPDDVAYRRRVGLKDMSIHGCDACCMEEE